MRGFRTVVLVQDLYNFLFADGAGIDQSRLQARLTILKSTTARALP